MRGHWVRATVAEYQAAIDAHGGLEALSVWSSLTDIDGQYGPPFVFTCWGTKVEPDVPVAACGGPPGSRGPGCPGDHAVFVPAAGG